jgi:hypothetical protein
MRLRKMAAVGIMLAGIGTVGSVAVAGPPPLDRPTPPPCCADGHGYASPCTYGFYATRWRRWPIECMDQMPSRQFGPTRPQNLGLQPYEPPKAEDEDRRAPPPTTPPEEPMRGPASTSPTGGAENRTTAPAAGPFPIPTPPPATLFQPGQPTDSDTPRRGTLPPYVPTGPTPKSLDSTGPTSDVDPPPSLPFGPGLPLSPGMMSARPATPPVDEVRQPSAGPILPVEERIQRTEVPASDDPPPSLPSILAANSN